MKYVYLVYEDWHGFQCVCATPEKATELVKKDAYSSGLPKDTPLDYEDEERWGLGRRILVGKGRGHSMTSFLSAARERALRAVFVQSAQFIYFFAPNVCAN